MAFPYGPARPGGPSAYALLTFLCVASLSCPASSRGTATRNALEVSTGDGRKPLMRQEPAWMLQAANATRPSTRRTVTVEDALTAARASQARDDDAVASALARTALELHLSVNETVGVMDAAARASTATTADTLQSLASGSLMDSILAAARSTGLSVKQVARIKAALATVDHRNYVAVLNVMRAASNASRPELSTAEKVAAVVSASAEANLSGQQVAMAAASATRAAIGGASGAAPLAAVARSAAAAGLSVASQAAVVAAVGAESPRSQMVIADMFNAARTAAVMRPIDQWTGGFGYGEDYGTSPADPPQSEAANVGRAVGEEIYDAPIPEKEKRAIVASATFAAAHAERPERLMNGTAGLSKEVISDLLSLSRKAHAAGFSDDATAAMKLRWQDMSPQHRAVAAKVLKAASAAQGKRPQKGPSSAERIAAVVRALEDAGVPAHEEATFAAAALRSGAEEAEEEVEQVEPWSKTILDDIVDLVKYAGLGAAQQSGVLQAVAPLRPTERRAVASIWAAAGNGTNTSTGTSSSVTRPLASGKPSNRRPSPSTLAPSASAVLDPKNLELVNVVVYAAMQAGAPPEVIDKVNALAQNMTPEEQVTTAAAVLNFTQKASAKGDLLSSVASAIAKHQQDSDGDKRSEGPAKNNVFESVAAPPAAVREYEATHHGSTRFVLQVRLACDRLLAFVEEAVDQTVNRSKLAIAGAVFSFAWPSCGTSRFRDARALHFPGRFSPIGACGGLKAEIRDPAGLRCLPGNGSQELFWLSGELGHGENLILIHIQELVLHEFGADGRVKEYGLCGGNSSTYIGCPSEAPVDLVYPARSLGPAATFCPESGTEVQNSSCFQVS